MKELRDTITFVAAIILFSAPLSVILVLGESVVEWWWLLGYYVVLIGLSFVLMGLKYSIVQEMGRDMAKIFLIFSLSGTSTVIILVFISFFVIRAMGHDVPSFIWVCFYVFAFVMGYQRFKEREETFVMLKKPKCKEEAADGISKTKKQIGRTCSNDKYGFSIKCPMGWGINDAKLPPETLVHFIDSEGGGINLMAGPTYGTQESIEELENLAIRNVRRFRGKMESLKRIKVDGVEAVEAVYAIPLGIKTKKIGFNKGGVEYIITCGVRSVKFEEYEPIFDECIQSFKFRRCSHEVRLSDRTGKKVKSQYDPAYG